MPHLRSEPFIECGGRAAKPLSGRFHQVHQESLSVGFSAMGFTGSIGL